MKLSSLLIAALLLSACNLSLAQDITPPPGYVPPTPAPTLGALYPAQAPDIVRGAEIYAAKCAACHGVTGLGDGEQGKQLPVSVAALGLPQVAWGASPADWYTIVTRGNIERFMPPFNSLTDQERWDVVAYALTLHVSERDLKRGKELYEWACADCPAEIFRNQEWMASLSNEELSKLLQDGTPDFPALESKLTEGGFTELAAYVRTLSFAALFPTPVPASVTSTVSSADVTPAVAETLSAQGTPLAIAASPTSTPEATGNTVTGSILGANVAGLNVKLRGFNHAQDQNAAPQEVLALDSTVAADGTFTFSNVEFVEGRIFVAEVGYSGVNYQSALAFVVAGVDSITIPPFIVYETSSDLSVIRFEQVHIFFEVSDGLVQVIAVYTFSNLGETTWLVESLTEIPFIKVPLTAQNVGFDRTQDSAPLLGTENGFAMPPSETTYGFVSFYTLPYTSGMQISQLFTQDADALLVLVPEGVKLKSDTLTQGDLQTFNNTKYREYNGVGIAAGSTLTVQLSGSPKSAGGVSMANILIVVGVLGILLISLGLWLYARDRRRADARDEDESEDDFASQEDLLDAIIALDDLHRAGKINADAYHARRAELKARLKDER